LDKHASSIKKEKPKENYKKEQYFPKRQKFSLGESQILKYHF